LSFDEGPFFQTERLERYKVVIAQLQAKGLAYACYMSPSELDALRNQQRESGEKPRYDGRWRPENVARLGSVPPVGIAPVIRFRNPDASSVVWEDAVKGRIEIANSELDDLVIARPDGTPTYNFCVVVDDIDMSITHVLRGDGHVNNTPRQINIFSALGATPPIYGHLPTVLGSDGEKLSKRHGATGVEEFARNGYLPEAIINALARLGWAHGNDEIFSPAQLVEWFDLTGLSPSPARFDPEKLDRLNAEHIIRLSEAELGARLLPFLQQAGYGDVTASRAALVGKLFKKRAITLLAMAEKAHYLFNAPTAKPEEFGAMVGDDNRAALRALMARVKDVAWDEPALAVLLKSTLTEFGLKAPRLFMPLRIALTGQSDSPSVDAVMFALGRELVIERLAPYILTLADRP
jgi:glutamyl-tRNA synthetase